jgi:hypothetical protein
VTSRFTASVLPVLALLISCSGGPATSASHQRHILVGTVLATEMASEPAPFRVTPSLCAHPNVTVGSTVTVSNPTGSRLATNVLRPPALHEVRDLGRGRNYSFDCQWPFIVSVPDRSVYVIKIPGLPTLLVREASLKRSDWTVAIDA